MNGRYTVNLELDKDIEPVINRITNSLILNFHPRSIILCGSFGRGEATVIKENGKLKFLSDCEIYVISTKYIPRGRIRKLILEIKDEIGLEVDIYGTTLSIYFLFPMVHRIMKPTIQNYELKYGSRVLFGKDYLQQIPAFKPQDIPLWEGIRLIFNRMAQALEHLPVNNDFSRESIFWANKIILACQDALLLLLGKYHHSYRVRNIMFQQLFPQYLNDLNKQVPKLFSLTIKATDQKLNSNFDYEDVDKLWFNTTEACDKVFRYLINKEMGIEFDNYVEFQEKYLRSPKLNQYHQSSISFNLYQNLLSILRIILLRRGSVSPGMIKKIGRPWKHMVYSIIPLFFFELLYNNQVNESYLRIITEALSLFKGIKGVNNNLSSDNIKEQISNLWYVIC